MKIILSLALSLMCTVAFTQGSGFRSEGREFYLGYLHPSYNDVGPANIKPFFKVYALISSYEDNEVSISYFDQLTKKEDYPLLYKIKGRQTTQIQLDLERMRMKNPGDLPGEFTSCHIVSQRPISVQYFSTGAASGGSYLALPVHAWGKSYVAASYNDGPGYLGHGAGVFVIVAAYDGTEVTIIPTARTGGDHIGVHQGSGANGNPQPYTVGLKRGQCWMVKSKAASLGDRHDISASIVKSSKPVAVISGHQDAYVGDGGTSGRDILASDFMIEQMVPVEFWTNTGMISIPFEDSPKEYHTGEGDNLRTYVYDEFVPAWVDVNGVLGNWQTPTPYRPDELPNTTEPSHFYTDSTEVRFSVVQYDMRRIDTAPPYTAPSMMNIVPRSSWRNVYQFYVPPSADEKFETYYVTIIGIKDGVERYHAPSDSVMKRNWFSDSIVVSINGSNVLKNISYLGGITKTWSGIQGHPDLRASTFKLKPGSSYYLHATFPFMAYHYGNTALETDPQDTLGNFNASEYYSSYSLPLGMSLSNSSVIEKLSITVDTLCNGWRICATDSNADGGIRYVTLIDDEDRDLWPDAPRQYSNCSIIPPDDEYHHGEFHLGTQKKSHCFTVEVNNPGKPSSAPIALYDKAGNCQIIELTRPAQQVLLEPDPDSVLWFLPKVGEQLCKEFVFVNLPSNQQSFPLSSLNLPQPTLFSVSELTPPIGSTIDPGDTLRLKICFSANDTLLYRDTVVLNLDCFALRIPLAGQAGTALILAEDYDFGTILVGATKCHDVEVKNVGNRDFTVTPDWVLTNLRDFSFDTAFVKNKLPLVIPPGGSHSFWICYQPRDESEDSDTMHWDTDIPEPYDKSIKTFTILKGRGIKPGVLWDRAKQNFRADSTAAVWQRINLVNASTLDAEITGITITGPDADEFVIVATEFNTNPPTYTGTVLSPGDTMWVDVRFEIDMTNMPITRHRTAQLQTAAKLDPTNIKIVQLEAGFDLAKVEISEASNTIRIRPNPARDRITLEVLLERNAEVSVAIYDVLGREVTSQLMGMTGPGWNSWTLNLQELAQGTYIAVISIGDEVETRSLIVE